MSGSGYFLGAVALLNSLRLHGHSEELVLLDHGLTPHQQRLLRPHVTLIPVPDPGEQPLLAKAAFHRYARAGMSVWVDADIIVTSPLHDVLDGPPNLMLGYPDYSSGQQKRWFAEWFSEFKLSAPLRRDGPYLNGGFLAFGEECVRGLVPRWEELCGLIPVDRVFRSTTDPFWAADQDALNALLLSEVPAGEVSVRPEREMLFPPEMRGVHVDVEAGTARLGGRPVRLLHYAFAAKPWEPSAWRSYTRTDPYTRLLRRLVSGGDILLSLDERTLPLWLRSDTRGAAARVGLATGSRAYRTASIVSKKLPDPLRHRVAGLRRKLVPSRREIE
jgi:hypothetical protein